MSKEKVVKQHKDGSRSVDIKELAKTEAFKKATKAAKSAAEITRKRERDFVETCLNRFDDKADFQCPKCLAPGYRRGPYCVQCPECLYEFNHEEVIRFYIAHVNVRADALKALGKQLEEQDKRVAELEPYKLAVDEALVVSHLGVAKGSPKEELALLAKHEQGVGAYFDNKELRAQLETYKRDREGLVNQLKTALATNVVKEMALEEANEKLAMSCVVCGGTPPASGVTCICGGSGSIYDAEQNARMELSQANARIAELEQVIDEQRQNRKALIKDRDIEAKNGAKHLIKHSEVSAENKKLRAQVEAFRSAAKEVMDCLEEHGESIVAHLMDTDENAGQRLRDLIEGKEKGEISQ